MVDISSDRVQSLTLFVNKGSGKLLTKNSLKKNFFYNFSYQLLVLILPFITLPYVSRVLGPELLGVYSKTHALANYFYLFTILGLKNYGNRTIARLRDDREKRSRTFWEIYVFQFFSSIIIFLLYVAFCLICENEFAVIYILQMFYVLSGVFDINWFCYGMEQFRLITVRSTAVRLLSVAAVFLFVHDKTDLPIYTAILSGSFLLSAVAVWPFLREMVDFIKPTFKGVKKHIIPNMILFWPTIAVSLYNIMDKILLGYFSTNSEVAFYSNAEKITTVPVTIILALDSVVMPRMSNIFAKNDLQQASKLMDFVMLFTMVMVGAMTFEIAAIAEIFAPWFYGKEFEQCGYYIVLLCPTILFKGWAAVLRTQFLLPTGRDKIYIISLTIGAITNLLLDILLIPSLQGIGAIIGTIAAEFVVAFIQFYFCRSDIPLKKYAINAGAFVLIGLVMYCCVLPLKMMLVSNVGLMAIRILVGSFIYCLLSYYYMIKIIKEPILVNAVLKMLPKLSLNSKG